MKIAIPITNNNQIDTHFGHAETFRIFEISDNKTINNSFDVKSSGCACKASIVGVLATWSKNYAYWKYWRRSYKSFKQCRHKTL